jgi:hypothetical protein
MWNMHPPQKALLSAVGLSLSHQLGRCGASCVMTSSCTGRESSLCVCMCLCTRGRESVCIYESICAHVYARTRAHARARGCAQARARARVCLIVMSDLSHDIIPGMHALCACVHSDTAYIALSTLPALASAAIHAARLAATGAAAGEIKAGPSNLIVLTRHHPHDRYNVVTLPGNTLGQAGPTFTRNDGTRFSHIPVAATMEFVSIASQVV